MSVRFLAVGAPTSRYTSEAAAGLMPAEMAVARRLYDEQTVREGYLDAAGRAVLLLDATDDVEVAAQLARYPMVAAGLVRFSVTALTGLPALAPLPPSTLREAWWPVEA